VLQAIGIRTIRLLTNNPRKVALGRYGVSVERVPLLATRNELTAPYLDVKRKFLGHMLPPRPQVAPEPGVE